MPKTGVLILGVLILLLSTTDVPAARMDMVKLEDRSAATLYAALGPISRWGYQFFKVMGKYITGSI